MNITDQTTYAKASDLVSELNTLLVKCRSSQSKARMTGDESLALLVEANEALKAATRKMEEGVIVTRDQALEWKASDERFVYIMDMTERSALDSGTDSLVEAVEEAFEALLA